MSRRLATVAALLAVLLAAAGCGGADSTAPATDPVTAPAASTSEPGAPDSSPPPTGSPATATPSPSPSPSTAPDAEQPAPREQLTVLAAASLTEVFSTLAKAYEAEHPGVTVRLSVDSSATLAEQVIQGAPADVLATADIPTMQRATDAQATDDAPEIFATNRLVLVVPKDNPAGIRRFGDLDKPGVSYVACVQTAPCGAIGRQALELNHVTAAPKSLEVDVKAVLSKVQLGEADAGLVYATDARAARDQVTAVPVPHADELVNDYPVAVVAGTKHADLAYAWVDLLVSDRGRAVLRQAGFGEP
jgi:molybdate transport system substrate-binding protein